MDIISKLKAQPQSSLAAIIFYSLTGLIFLFLLPLANFPPHIGIISLVSLIAAYGLFKKRFWSKWLVLVLFLSSAVFSIFTIYYAFSVDLLTSIAFLFYLIFISVFTALVFKSS